MRILISILALSVTLLGCQQPKEPPKQRFDSDGRPVLKLSEDVLKSISYVNSLTGIDGGQEASEDQRSAEEINILKNMENDCEGYCNGYDMAMIYSMLSSIYSAKNDVKNSLSYKEKALSHSSEIPVRLESSLLMGAAYDSYHLGKYEDAISHLDRFGTLNPQGAVEEKRLFANIEFQRGNYQASLESINQAISMKELSSKQGLADGNDYNLKLKVLNKLDQNNEERRLTKGKYEMVNISRSGLSPIKKISPKYPPVAEQRGMEGYCTVGFDILSDGSTANIKVIDCSNPIFESESILAMSKFKFEPSIDGSLIFKDDRYRFVFEFVQ